MPWEMKRRRRLIGPVVIALLFFALGWVASTLYSPGRIGIGPGSSGSSLFELPKESRVKRVVDGDTIELENGEMVRYIGLDAPEVWKKEEGGWLYQPQPFAEESLEFNRRLVEGKKVRLEYDVVLRDKYNRLLAYVYVGDLFVNAEMVKEGYAVVYTLPPNLRYTDLFVRLQREAREGSRGVWFTSR